MIIYIYIRCDSGAYKLKTQLAGTPLHDSAKARVALHFATFRHRK